MTEGVYLRRLDSGDDGLLGRDLGMGNVERRCYMRCGLDFFFFFSRSTGTASDPVVSVYMGHGNVQAGCFAFALSGIRFLPLLSLLESDTLLKRPRVAG